MINAIITYYNGGPLFVFNEVAKQLAISDGQIIRSEQEFSNIIEQNSSMPIAKRILSEPKDNRKKTVSNANDPAFPTSNNSQDPEWAAAIDGGITKREYLAAKAMQGLLSNPNNYQFDALTTRAYQITDMMIEAGKEKDSDR